MTFSDDDLRHIETLACIRLDDESRKRLRPQIERIIGFVRRLEQTDTSAYEPRAYVGSWERPLRKDAVASCLPRDEVLDEAPGRNDGYFRVPPVIGTEET